MERVCNVALIGQQFMGRAHSNAYLKVAKFFDVPLTPVLHTVAARDQEGVERFAQRWGWQQATTRWREIADNDAINLVDVCTPNDVHAEQSIAMLEAGKHVACEKPLADTLEHARAMKAAAAKAKGKTFVWFNYRRCPAVALAYQLVREGRIGRLYHVRASYLQSWGGPDTPLVWRFEKKRAGSGAHGDLNAHIIDLARFLTGDQITEVTGGIAETFIKERVKPGSKSGERGRSDVDDCVVFLARFKQGAVASFEATRLATGHQNANYIELNGSAGALRWNFEDMNLLWFYDNQEDARTAGWRRIMCTSGGHHPYADAWWPDAHIIGYEHGFVNMTADILRVLGGQQPLLPLPDFADAYETQRVLEAALLAAKHRSAVKMSEVK
ncbi:MAG TPA: Gfo/Idh/MocA family oxidoreductase [Phycisphaerae bacterium]|nr:Gfo/Idh/MocA family oxidoreductase [Phycisphaerae bacterium]HNU43827.1 Gfo/Idh/MocA family oxidoreductase [Phycisphaerae bacterium]